MTDPFPSITLDAFGGRNTCRPASPEPRTESRTVFDLKTAAADEADVRFLPVAFEGTVSYGRGTAQGPAAILQASCQVELWDDETGVDLEQVRCHTAPTLCPEPEESVEQFLLRVENRAAALRFPHGLTAGIGGEHSITPHLIRAAFGQDDLSGLTVVQFDAHADLRDEYEGTPFSHACAMKRVVDSGARLIGVGIRSCSAQEARLIDRHDRIRCFRAQDLAACPDIESRLHATLRNLTGPVYVTVDVDGLECQLSPATGTPEPGGLSWWVFLRFLRAIIAPAPDRTLIGADVVETVPMPGSQVNEFTAARILAKIMAYSLTGENSRKKN